VADSLLAGQVGSFGRETVSEHKFANMALDELFRMHGPPPA